MYSAAWQQPQSTRVIKICLWQHVEEQGVLQQMVWPPQSFGLNIIESVMGWHEETEDSEAA